MNMLDTTSQPMKARAIKSRQSHVTRRAKSEAVLAEILPADLERGCTYHVMSHGDVDALSYLAHAIKAQPMDYVMISTWVMAASDVKLLERWVDEGRIQTIDFNFGEHMTGQYGDVLKSASDLAIFTGGGAKIARNHSKIILARNEAADYYLTCEGSANVNTNPRIEQTALTLDRDLFLFFHDFFADLKSIRGKAT